MSDATTLNVQKLKISQIRRDGATQPRAELDQGAVQDYAEAMKDGAKFPPVTVYFDGTDYWLSNGFHRCASRELLGWLEIEAEVVQGTQRDAQWASFAANKEQGLRRQASDVTRILTKIFSDPQWKDVSQREIAAHVGCGKTTVGTALIAYRQKTGQDGPRAGPAPVNKGTKKADRFEELDDGPGQAPARESAGTDPGGGPTPPGPGRNTDGVRGAGVADPAVPWADYEAKIREAIGTLRLAYRQIAAATEYHSETKQIRNKWAPGSYSAAGTIGVISSLARALENGLPVSLCDEPPGFLTAARAELKGALGRKTA